MPKDLKLEKLRKGEMTFCHFQHLTLCKWKDTRDVMILSTKYGASCSEIRVKCMDGSGTVSYTHLDVYKRQV